MSGLGAPSVKFSKMATASSMEASDLSGYKVRETDFTSALKKLGWVRSSRFSPWSKDGVSAAVYVTTVDGVGVLDRVVLSVGH
jgi:hypothetical protein